MKLGWEGNVLYGAPGSTGTNLLTNTRDMSISGDPEKGDTTVRGDSTVAPIHTESVTIRNWTFEFTMIHDITDTFLEALRVAAAAGTAVALRCKDKIGGKGYDGDVILSMNHGQPLNGEQTLVFTATPNRDHGRVPQLYV